MPLETATYTSQLVTANPAHTDGLSQADSHMRLLKSTIQATFPNFTAAALVSTQAQLDLAATVAAGTSVSTIPLGTALLPGLTPVGNPNTGIWSPAANQLAISLNGVQQVLIAGTALVTTLGVAAAAFTTTGAYSGGTGQLVPIGAVLEWYDDVLPAEGGYCWADSQIISSANTVCPILLARWGSRFGGNGTTTMGVPDRRDTVGIGKSSMGGGGSRGLQTLNNTVLGALIGAANVVLALANFPTLTATGTNTISVGANNANMPGTTGGVTQQPSPSSGGNPVPVAGSGVWAAIANFFSGSNTITVSVAGTGSNTAVSIVQPSTTCNYILRLA